MSAYGKMTMTFTIKATYVWYWLYWRMTFDIVVKSSRYIKGYTTRITTSLLKVVEWPFKLKYETASLSTKEEVKFHLEDS